jgi:hypothetical protein
MTEQKRKQNYPKDPSGMKRKKTKEMNYMQIKCNGKEGKTHQTEGFMAWQLAFSSISGFQTGFRPCFRLLW